MPPILSPPQRLLLELSGLLACEPGHFAGLRAWAPKVHLVVGPVDRHKRLQGFAPLADSWQDVPPPEPQIISVDGRRIGLIDVTGLLVKSDLPGQAGLTYLAEQVRELVDEGQVDGILLRIDSPGGSVAGTQELAEEVRRARQTKPVFAYVEDLCAASAYWVASQCEKVFVNVATAMVGSIGTFVGLYDRKQQFVNAGVKAIVIRAGEFKALGFPGTEITKEHREYLQGQVDGVQAEFLKAVAHRRIAPAAIASGRLYLAGDAVKLRLIDGVKSFDAVVAELVELAGQSKRK